MADTTAALCKILTDRFTRGELRKLCQSLSIDSEEFSSAGKSEFVLDLVDYYRRRKSFVALYEAIRVERPDVYEDLPEMPDGVASLPASPAPPALSSKVSAAPPASPPSASPVSPSSAARAPWKLIVAGVAALIVIVIVFVAIRSFGAQAGSGSQATYRYGAGNWTSWQQTFTTNGANSRPSPSGDDFCIDVLNPGQDIWDIEVGPNPILLPSNRSYTLSVTARATTNRLTRVHLKYAPLDDVSVAPNDSMVLGPEPSTHTFDFSLRTDQPIQSVWVSVLVGGKDQGLGTVCLSSVVIEPK